MKVSDYIATFLERQGVTCVFELSGGMIAHMLDSLGTQKKSEWSVCTTNREPHLRPRRMAG